MRDGVEKAVLLFVSVNFANQENGVDDDSGDDQGKEDDAEDERNDLAPVEDDPGDVQRDCQPNQAGAQGHEKRYRFCTARNAHRELPETILDESRRKKENRGEIPPRSAFLRNIFENRLVSDRLLRHRLFDRDDGHGWIAGTGACRNFAESSFGSEMSQARPKHAQGADAVPVRINFIPGNAVARRLRDRVMIVVPAFAERQDRDPETVRGVIAGQEALRPPHVRGGVYQPGGVQAENGPEENAPHQIGQSAKDQQERCQARSRESSATR